MKQKLYLGLILFVVIAFTASAKRKAAFLSTFDSLIELKDEGDDDEAAAADWFVNVYGGTFLPSSQVNDIDLSQFNVVWLAIDRPWGIDDFPEELISDPILSKLTEYYKNGGNFLLTNFAYSYIAKLGRFPQYEDDPIFAQNNEYEEGYNQYFQTFFGHLNPETTTTISHADDPIFKGLRAGIAVNGEDGINGVSPCMVFPLISAGWRENHFCYWGTAMPEPYTNTNIDKYEKMYEEYKVVPLATNDGTQDYFGAPIARWDPHEDYQGTAIGIGLSVYEWNANNRVNAFQDNIELLTRNALDILGGNEEEEVVVEPKKAAFISTFDSLTELKQDGDDDEAAAADWFVNVYGGSFLPTSQINDADLSQFNVIWLAIDRPWGIDDFPEELTTDPILPKLTEYYKNGGNFLLTNFAYSYIAKLGRFPQYEDDPIFAQNNEYEEGYNQYFQTFFGHLNPETTTTISHADDPIFKGLRAGIAVNGDEGINGVSPCMVFPLISAGWRENHFCYWGSAMPDPYTNTNVEKYQKMYDDYKVVPLATNDGTQDYFGAPIARWEPHGDYQGTAIGIGLSVYEWNANGRVNAFQDNIELLTKNALDILGGDEIFSGIETPVTNKQHVLISTDKNKIYLMNNIYTFAKIYDISGSLHGVYLVQRGSEIDISNFAQGVYICVLTGENGTSISTKFIK
jgi:hypothetical protein